MTSRHFFPNLLLAGSMFFCACSNDAPTSNSNAAQQPAPVPTVDTSATALAEATDTTTSEPVTAATPGLSPRPSLQPGETPIDESAKSAPGNPSKHEIRSVARPSNKVVKHTSPFQSNTTAAVKKQNPAGNATGFIGRENIGFYSEPSTSSQKISTLKIYESVIILETKMTDEFDKTYDMPQWYKVQLTNKKVGWVIGTSLTLN